MKAIFEAAKKQTSATKELGLEELCESNMGFRFDFNIPTNEKKKRKAKKKKKKTKSASAEDNDNDNDNDADDILSQCTEDESPCAEAEVLSALDSPSVIREQEGDDNNGSSAISNAEEAKNTSSIAKQEPRPREEQSKDLARTAKPTIVTTTTTANAAKANKKKKKKPKKKDAVETEKDDFDEIVERVIAQNKKNELAAAEKQLSVRPPPGLIKGNGPRFVSPNDPELDPKTRLIAKYGQGKNLVAVGPRRMKDPFWLKDNSPDYENQIAKSMAEVVLNEPQTSHHTPFTFSFGLG